MKRISLILSIIFIVTTAFDPNAVKWLIQPAEKAVAFSPDDKRLITGGRDKPMIGELLQEIFGDSKFNPGVSARLWDIETGTLLQTFSKHGNDVMDAAYSNNGKWIATASADKTVELWQLNR